MAEDRTQKIIEILIQPKGQKELKDMFLGLKVDADVFKTGIEGTGEAIKTSSDKGRLYLQLLSKAMKDGKVVTDEVRDAIEKMSNAQAKAAVEANKAAAATERDTAAKGKNTSAVKANSDAYGLLQKAMGIATAAFSVKKLIDTSDAFTNMHNQLKLVTTNGAEADRILEKIKNTSLATQTSVTANVGLFRTLNNTLKDQKVSMDDQLKILDTVTKSMYAFGSSGAGAESALIQLGQAFAKGKLSGQEFNSVAENAPGVLIAIAKGLGITRGEVQKMKDASAGMTSEAKKDAKELADIGKVGVDQLAKATTRAKDHSDALQRMRLEGKYGTEEFQKLSAKATESSKDFAKLKDQASRYATELARDMQKGVASGGLSIDKLVQALLKANAEMTKMAAAASGTIKGALENLNTQFIFYVGNADKASGASRYLVQAINFLGNNLNTVIPAIALFGAAWAAVSIVGIVASIGTLIATLGTLGVTMAAFLAANPLLLALGLIVGAIALVITKTIGWKAAWDGVVAGWGMAVKAWDVFWNAVKNPTETLNKLWDWIAAGVARFFENVQSQGAAVVRWFWDFVSPITELYNWIVRVIDAWRTYLSLKGGGSASMPANDNGGAPTALPAARSGMDMVVPGAGAPDTRLFQAMVSPGERVIVQTHAQQKQAQAAGIPHFRDGGSVTMGLGIAAQFQRAAEQVVPGYKGLEEIAKVIKDSATSSQPKPAPANDNDARKKLIEEMNYLAYVTQMLRQNGPEKWLWSYGWDYDDYSDAKYRVGQLKDMGIKEPQFTRKQLEVVYLEKGASTSNMPDYARPGFIGADPYTKARDGYDGVVPGAGAVDSRLMAVTPGEHVTVETPAQRRARARSEGGRRNVTVNAPVTVIAADPGAFNRSERQVAQKFARTLRRAN